MKIWDLFFEKGYFCTITKEMDIIQIPQILISLGTKFHLRGHTFMKIIKIYQFRDPNPKPITSLNSQKWTKDLLFNNNRFRKHVAICKIRPAPLLFGRHKCMVPQTKIFGPNLLKKGVPALKQKSEHYHLIQVPNFSFNK